MLADELRKSGKYDEAVRTYKEFTEKFPQHSLHTGALYSIAVTLDIAGKRDEALPAFQRILSSHPQSGYANYARLAIARIYKAQGKVEDVRSLLKSTKPDAESGFRPGDSEAQEILR